MNKKLDHINANWKFLVLLCYKFLNFYQYSIISPVPVVYGRSSGMIWWFWKYWYRISCKNNTTKNALITSLVRKNIQRQIMMYPIPTVLKHFFLMSWIVLLAIQMNILLVSSVVNLAIGINLVVCSSNSIGISSNSIVILSNSIAVSKKWRILHWNSRVVYKKPPSAPCVAFFVGLTPFMYLLAGILHDPQKKTFVMMFQILKLGNWIFRLFRGSPLYRMCRCLNSSVRLLPHQIRLAHQLTQWDRALGPLVGI